MRNILTTNIKPESIEEILILSIKPDNRTREEMGVIKELSEDIKEVGLLQPIVVMKISEEQQGKEKKPWSYQLLAGGRRLLAVTEYLNWSHIMANLYPEDLPPLAQLYVELVENVSRKDMTFVEEASLKLRIHQTQVELKGGRSKGGGETWTGHSVKETADIFNESPTQTAADIELGKAIKEIPELGKCKNKHEANKMWAKMKEKLLIDELAKRVEVREVAKPEERKKKELIDSYIVGDTFEIIREIDDKEFDLIEVDSPFGIGLNKGGQKRGGGKDKKKKYNEWTPEQYTASTHMILEESYRLLKDAGWLIMWFAQEPWYEFVKKSIREAGFDCNGIAGLWSKGTGQTNWPDRYMGSSYETFFYARKGKACLNKEGRNNIFSYPTVSLKNVDHLTPKPVELYMDLFYTFIRKDQNVLIPFLGSGSGLLALDNLGGKGVGCDSSQDNKNTFIWQVEHGRNSAGDYSSYKKTKEENTDEP